MVKNYDTMLSRFHLIPACDGGTGGQTELLYQWCTIKIEEVKQVLYSDQPTDQKMHCRDAVHSTL